MARREHAVLLCRVAGLQKAASGGNVGGLGGREEMGRLCSLGGDGLQAAVTYTHLTLPTNRVG